MDEWIGITGIGKEEISWKIVRLTEKTDNAAETQQRQSKRQVLKSIVEPLFQLIKLKVLLLHYNPILIFVFNVLLLFVVSDAGSNNKV